LRLDAWRTLSFLETCDVLDDRQLQERGDTVAAQVMARTTNDPDADAAPACSEFSFSRPWALRSHGQGCPTSARTTAGRQGPAAPVVCPGSDVADVDCRRGVGRRRTCVVIPAPVRGWSACNAGYPGSARGGHRARGTLTASSPETETAGMTAAARSIAKAGQLMRVGTCRGKYGHELERAAEPSSPIATGERSPRSDVFVEAIDLHGG
jgi:hypothetical protein